MPRQPRIIVPGLPHHIVQRGHNRSNVFLDATDFDKGRSLLLSASKKYRCHIHVYVQMNNHLHLLVTPIDEYGPARLMQSFGSSYALHFNDRYEQTGPLWEGRYSSFVVGTERYFFDCSRYIEMNPVRALMSAHPGEYSRSSFLQNAMGVSDPLITPHPLYESLGQTSAERRTAYQALFTHQLDANICDAIRRATRTGDTLRGEGAPECGNR